MNIFFISPHPDDVEFGCGGIIQKSCIAKHKLYCFVNTYCENKNDNFFNSNRKKESLDLEKIKCEVHFWENQDVYTMVSWICKIKPEVIIMPYEMDTNETHRQVYINMHFAIERAKIGGQELEAYYTPCVLFYETFSTIKFIPDLIVDVTSVYTLALKQLKVHQYGIKVLPSLPYVFQVKHQSRGIEGSCLYGEGLVISKSNNHMWNCNLRVLLEYLMTII